MPPAPTPPPLGPSAVLTRVDYELRVDGEAAAMGRVLLTIDVLRDGWTKVAIPVGLIAREARIDGRPVALVGGKEPHVLLSRAGRSIVTLDVAMPLTASAGTEAVVVPSSPSPISQVTLTVPRRGVTLTAGDGFITERAEAADQSRWVVYGRPNRPMTLSWKRRADDRRAELPLKIRARILQIVGLGEELGQVTASVRVDVQQGLAREVSLALPSGLSINQVDGATVGDWSTEGATLRVRFLEPVATDVSLVVQGDVRTPREGLISIPLLRMPAAERESGGVAVDVAGSGELSGRQPRGMDLADVSDLGDIVAGRESPSMAAFRYRQLPGSEPRALTVTVVRYTPQAVLIANVEEARFRTLASEDGRLLVEARYAVRNNQRSFLKVTLPEGATLWNAEVGGRPTRPGVAEAGSVLLPLEKGRAGEEAPTFVVSLVYLQRVTEWAHEGSVTVSLPALDLPVSRTGVEFHYSARYRIDLLPGSFRLDQNLGPTTEALRVRHDPSLNPAPSSQVMRKQGADTAAGLQSLADRFRSDAGGRVSSGTLPVPIAFPMFGSSVFLASELTPELQSPVLTFSFKRVRN